MDIRLKAIGSTVNLLPSEAAERRDRNRAYIKHFWCCHCTLLQANANLHESIYYSNADGISVCQYLPSKINTIINDTNIKIEQNYDYSAGEGNQILPITSQVCSRPNEIHISMDVQAASPTKLTLKFRRPWWLKKEFKIIINGEETTWNDDGKGFACVERTWDNDLIRIILTKGLTCWPLPDRTDIAAFMDGPVVLAGLVEEERMLYGDINDPTTMLIPDDERQWSSWKNGWRTVNQPVGWRFKPLYEIGNEKYTVYFQVRQ